MSKKFREWGRTDFAEKLEFNRGRSTILPLDETTAILAGEMRASVPVQGMGMVDCIILAISRIYNSKIVTGDPHFRGLGEAEFIGD